jgi:enoyl-CoA hydratase/carnithine racemase
MSVSYERDGHVVTITLERPEHMNSIDVAMTDALRSAVDRFEQDTDARVGILTGAGDRAFCAGMDLKAFGAGQGPLILGGIGHFGGFVNRPNRTKPIIAAVNGFALAGGCELALACELIIASDDARFGTPEVKRSIFAGAGGIFRLTQRLTRAQAMEILLTGDAIDAATALRWGLINQVVPKNASWARPGQLAARIVANAPLSIQETLRVANATTDHTEEELWALTNERFAMLATSNDAAEGIASFTEKRPAKWTAT